MKVSSAIFFLFLSLCCYAQGPYAGIIDSSSSIAIHKDSAIIVDWASQCSIERGWVNIADTTLGKASVGDSSLALGQALANGVVSLGDGGSATVQFNGTIFNGPGPDFVVYENSFSNTFLELAFVEVSSDGLNYVRFPAYSLTDTNAQVGGFGSVSASNIHNLAGKYPAGYGTPFDLEDVRGVPNLNVQAISHIRIVDVVGSIQNQHARRDAAGRKINDPFPTPFPSSGFDLDAVGAIHMNTVGVSEEDPLKALVIYPNPVEGIINLSILPMEECQYEIRSLEGRLIRTNRLRQSNIEIEDIPSGPYLLIIRSKEFVHTKKFFKL